MTTPGPDFETVLYYLKETRGFDFTGYKRSSLIRRVERRMSQVGIRGHAEYLDHLQVHPDEFTALFNTILINVTGFFRDPDAWEYLREEVLPSLLAHRPVDAAIRVWSAGCASGEEAYTLAIVLAEILGVDEFRQRVKIYATDVDEEGLTQARNAAYNERAVSAMPPDLVARYFEPNAGRYHFRKDLRRSVIFGRNDLVQDAPISRVDLLVCRNTLMYLNAETQSRILNRFHFALADSGFLFLGKAEMLLSHGNLFAPVDPRRRVFRKVAWRPTGNGVHIGDSAPSTRAALAGLERLRNEAFLASPVAQIVVTAEGLVAMINRQAEMLLAVSSRDVGRPFRDLDVSYRPVELRRFIEQTELERRSTRVSNVELFRMGGDVVKLEVQINPVVDGEAGLLGVNLFFHDVTDPRRLQDELEHANRQLEAAYEELQSTNEELETTNEELQSTVEELETTNEELQSTNEELETMNEELHSTNDELQHMNEQLRETTDNQDRAKAFLETVLTSLRAGVTVLDRDMRVQVWNRRAEDLWGLRQEEALGQHLLNLDIGLPTDQLRPLIRRTLADGEVMEVQLKAINRRGRPVAVRVVCTALKAPLGEVDGAVLVMEDEPEHDGAG
jgi:two-component system, chemotaxis family, CheB/CheR fusion protein